MSLLFSVTELEKEVTAFAGLASQFLAPGSDGVLRSCVSSLRGIAKSQSGPRRWEISQSNPVRTVASQGQYMPDAEGSLTVHGEVSFVWQVEPERPPGDTSPAKTVRLVGLASTLIRILIGQPGTAGAEEVAVWRMEVADAAAPGTHFHVQVLGRDDDPIFPKALDVPRLPGVLNSPFAAMEFMLGELFQEEWARTAQKDSGACQQWRGIQSRRHERHLDWAKQQVSVTSGSPWVAWKLAKPDPSIFM